MAAAHEERETEIVAAPGEIRVLDGGVPWIRTSAELDRERARVERMLLRVQREHGLEYDDLDGPERSLLGMAGAAWWTLGARLAGPMTNVPRAVTGAGIRQELARAEEVMVSRDFGWESATGVLYWLLWITGATEELEYPGW